MYVSLWNQGFREITDFEISDFVKSLLNSWNDWIGELGLGLATNNAKRNFFWVISQIHWWFHEIPDFTDLL